MLHMKNCIVPVAQTEQCIAEVGSEKEKGEILLKFLCDL